MMLHYHYFRDIEAPRPVPRIITEDLGVTEEEFLKLGPMLDAPSLYAQASLFAAARHMIGSWLVRLGQLIQDRCDPDVPEPACSPLGSAE